MADHGTLIESELDAQALEVLPPRETLWLTLNINIAPVIAVNNAVAIQMFTIDSVNIANAQQWVGTLQG
ncbi:hypothetical protein [Georgenia yuyongxinii]